MDTHTQIINKVASSGLITIDLAEYLPKDNELITIDIKPWLFMDLILKEKDFRATIEAHDWKQYQSKYIAITCTSDAIIPKWAFMLIAEKLTPIAKAIYFGNSEQVKELILLNNIKQDINPANYQDNRVVIKGCGEVSIPESGYILITNLLVPFVKSLMFGEPCSTVPIFKRKK